MKFLFALVVLAVLLLLGGELLLKPAAESAVADILQSRYQLSQKPEVQLNGFPFLVKGVAGRLDSVVISLDGYDANDLRVEHFSLRLQPVTFSIASILRTQGQVRTEHGTAVATVTDSDISSYLTAHNVPLTVRMGSRGVTVSRSIRGLVVAATGRLSFASGKLHFSPDQVEAAGIDLPGPLEGLFAFDVNVPPIAGVQLTSLSVGEGEAVVTADVTGYVISEIGRAVRVTA